jgi:hypothetical protein
MCVYVAGNQKCCKNLANTRLDLRNADNSLQIEGQGVLPGDPSHGGVGTRDTGPYIYIYMHIIYVCTYIYIIYILPSLKNGNNSICAISMGKIMCETMGACSHGETMADPSRDGSNMGYQ